MVFSSCSSMLTECSPAALLQERLRKSEALKDELSKFLQEHGALGCWLEQSEQELRCLGEGETDAQGLKGRLEEHRKVRGHTHTHTHRDKTKV